MFDGNLWLEATRNENLQRGVFACRTTGMLHSIHRLDGISLEMRRANMFFPAYICNNGPGSDRQWKYNSAQIYQESHDVICNVSVWGQKTFFHHVLATLHDPGYREANAGALRMEWPRIPLPGWPDGNAADAAETLVCIVGARPRTGPTT